MATREERRIRRAATRVVQKHMEEQNERFREMDDMTARMLGKNPITPPGAGANPGHAFGQVRTGGNTGTTNPARAGFIDSLTQLFGFRRTSKTRSPGPENMEFVKVDSQSDMRIAQGKMGKTFNTKMVGKLEELFDAWLRDTTDTYKILEDRNKRISEIEFAVMNDPFLSMAADMYADEATQIDVQGKLVTIECADVRMKEKMEDLLEQWGVTQNRLRSVAYNLATYGDAFWSNKVTVNGVVRIVPIGIHQVKERLEFNPVQVQTDISLRKGYITAINRSAKLQALFDTMENVENEEFADLFDTRLFGFAIDDDMVVPPWAVTHFRLNSDQSEFFPMGKSFFLKALAPFRQCNATMVLQSLARVMSFPVTVYTVKTAPGMDEGLQFEKINEVREAYDLIGDSGAGNEAFSVNTKIWAPEGLITLEMHSPDIDIKAVEDIEMYQDRVAIASGIPKGYLVQEWGGFGNSAISLVEQYKPFARRVFTVQSAILDGLSNLFRLHFAITGEFDYRESFVLSLKFPNEEVSDARQAAKQSSLNLSKDVLETIASIVGAINDPLPPEVIQDILTKFSFLDPDDIKKWIKNNPNQKEQPAPDELGDEGGGLGGDLGGFGGGGGDLGGDLGGDMGADDGFGGEMDLGTEGGSGEGGMMPGPEEGGMPDASPDEKQEAYRRVEQEVLREQEQMWTRQRTNRFQERQVILKSRYKEVRDTLYEKVIKNFSRIDEATINNRHYKYARVEDCNVPMYQLFQKKEGSQTQAMPLFETKELLQEMKDQDKERAQTWEDIKTRIREAKLDQPAPQPDEPEQTEEQKQADENHTQAIISLIS